MARFAVALLACGLIATAFAAPKEQGTMIVGGEPAVEGQIPFQVSMQYRGSHSCGGSIIVVNGKQVVITAAHCVVGDSASDWILIGGDVKRSDTTGHEQRRVVTKIVYHAQYSSSNFRNDIAIMFIDQPFELTDYVQPIALPEPMQQTPGNIQVSGWGTLRSGDFSLPDVLQWVVIPVVDDAKCGQSYPGSIVDAMLCAGLEQGGKDSCQGDSGGPLQAVDGKYLAGIVSWGRGCASAGYPGVNTEVSYHIDWIETTVAANA